MANEQRFWDDVQQGQDIAPLAFPLTVYRLVMAAGANRDFNAIHHNPEVARASGASDIYANTLLLQGMWERAARGFIGLAGVIRRQSGFRMRSFSVPGETVVVKGRVQRKWRDGDLGFVELAMWSENRSGVSVGPGSIVATLPLRRRL
jgi:acyl dehydratase